MEFFAYILESGKLGRWYYGSCNDMEDRLRRHNAGHSKATKGGRPWRLVATKSFPTRAEAMALEQRLKRCRNKAYALTLMT